MGKTKPQEQVIQEFREVHGEKYDYSKFVYTRINHKGIIICPRHGEFEQTAGNHRRGWGCKKCGYEDRKLRKTTESFIERATKKHGGFYDYSKVDYTGNHDKVTIVCPDHGEFEQRASSHLEGKKCAECAKENRERIKRERTVNKFLRKANKVYDSKYDYGKTNYVDMRTKVVITCPVHGDYEETPDYHLQGSGCKQCELEEHRAKYEKINLERYKEIHGDKYDYSEFKYLSAKDKTTVICPDHGPFQITPAAHRTGNGCVSCAAIGISKLQKLWLDDIIGIPDDNDHREVFIESEIRSRGYYVDGYDPRTKTVYEFLGDYWHGNPNRYNPEDMNSNKGLTYGELHDEWLKRKGDLEDMGYKVECIWESDFNEIVEGFNDVQCKDHLLL